MVTKKILIILNDLSGGGAERVFVNIANGFMEAGLEVEFLLGRKQGVYFDLLNTSIPVHELKAFNLLQYATRLPGFLRGKQYTHIFTASDYISVAAVIAKKRLNLEAILIATLHYNLPYQLSILPFRHQVWIKFLNRRFIARADLIVAVSQGVADGFRKIVGDKRTHHLRVIYNPVYDDNIYQKAAEKVAEDFFEKGMITLINIGRLEGQKNQALLIRSFSRLVKKKENIRLLIIGTGTLEKQLKEQVQSLGLQDRIHLLGFRLNPFAYLSKSDLLVLSSAYEGLPTVLIEALALGVNVVSTDCPSGPAEILDQGKYGQLAVNKDEGALELAIERALLDKKDPAFLQQRALVFHKKNIISEYLNLVY